MGHALCLHSCAEYLTRMKFDGAPPVFNMEGLYCDEILDNEDESENFTEAYFKSLIKNSQKVEEVPK